MTTFNECPHWLYTDNCKLAEAHEAAEAALKRACELWQVVIYDEERVCLLMLSTFYFVHVCWNSTNQIRPWMQANYSSDNIKRRLMKPQISY